MEAPPREPCAACAEPVALDARLCAQCGHSALVDVALEQPVADPRLRYQASRAVSALGRPYGASADLQKVMARPRGPLVRGLTRGQGMRVRDALAPLGLAVSIAPAKVRSPRRAQVAGVVAVLVVALATLAALVAMRERLPPAPERPGPDTAASPAAGGEATGEAGGSPMPAGSGPAPATPMPRAELARRALASTASLRCGEIVGAGFFVSEGLLLTNAHVLCRNTSRLRVVLSDGRETTGTPIRTDEELDLALVSAGGLGAPPLPLGDAAATRVGDRVLMVGSPVGMDFTVHEGMVSAMGRVILGAAYIQLDAKVNPGNSGGPLLDEAGRVVGVVSLKRKDAEGIALALPINYAYSGQQPMVAAPAEYAPQAFEAMLARARQEDQAQAGALAATGLRPLLAGVYVNPQRQVLARILRPSRHHPSYEDFSFKVWNGSSEVCAMTSSVGDWRPVDLPEATARSDARVQAWLQKHGLPAQLYQGEAPLRLDLCARDQLRPGVQLELQGAEPAASRVALY